MLMLPKRVAHRIMLVAMMLIIPCMGIQAKRNTGKVMPQFPGGTDAMVKFLRENLIYPIECENNGIQGRVVAQFVVDSVGEIRDVEITNSAHPLLDEEAIRLINIMPSWIPGKVDGMSVSVRYTLPINFQLEDDEIEKFDSFAEFPGGKEGILKYLKENVIYPTECEEKGIQGRVVVAYTVGTDGTICNIRVVKSVHPQIDWEAIRVVKKMPRYKPAIRNGKPVSVNFCLPITFALR